METLIINVPDKKRTVVKLILKELGVTIQNKTKAQILAEKISKGISSGEKPTMDEIVFEIKEMRAGR